MHVAVEGSSFYHISVPTTLIRPATSQTFSQPTLGRRYVSSPSRATTDSLIPQLPNAIIAKQHLRYISSPQSIHELRLYSPATTPKEEPFVPQSDGSHGSEEVFQRAVKLLPRSLMSAVSESSTCIFCVRCSITLTPSLKARSEKYWGTLDLPVGRTSDLKFPT